MLFNQIFAASVIFIVIVFSSHRVVAQVIFESNELIISAKTERCASQKNGIDHNYTLLSVENKTSHELSVQFEKELWYANNCVTCGENNTEHTVNLTIDADEIIEGSCQKDYRELMIFHSSNQEFIKDQLTKFELKDVKIITN